MGNRAASHFTEQLHLNIFPENLGPKVGEAFFGGSRGIYAPEIMLEATRL